MYSIYINIISYYHLQFSFAEFQILKYKNIKNVWSSATCVGLSASLNTGRTSLISIYKLLLCQFWHSQFNRTWIYANERSHYAYDLQSHQTVSSNGSFAIELHVWCLTGSFDIYIASTVALTGNSSSQVPVLPCQLFYFPHSDLLTEPWYWWSHLTGDVMKMKMPWKGVSRCNFRKYCKRI